MKKLISCLVFFGLITAGSLAIAGPYAVTGEFPTDAVSSCKFVLNGGTAVSVIPTAVATDATKSYCSFDVISSVNGNNVVSVTYTNLWGSSAAVPFSYAKTLPPTPSGIKLRE